MKELQNVELIKLFSSEIKKATKKPIRLMILSGSQYVLSVEHKLSSLLPENVELVPGPGCANCLLSPTFIDQTLAYCHHENIIITTFDHLADIPGSVSSLRKEKNNGADIRIVESLMDALLIAKRSRRKKVVFPGYGFENSATITAGTIIQAQMAGLKNFYVFGDYKLLPPVMKTLFIRKTNIDGYIVPCDISLITGTKCYKSLPIAYGKGIVVSGNDLTDLLQSILMLVYQNKNHNPKVETECTGGITPDGDIKAQQLIEEVFETTDTEWPGLGKIADSGLKIRDTYAMHRAETNIDVDLTPYRGDETGCVCGEILTAAKTPEDCPLFGKECTPQAPAGACMASAEGACFASYIYGQQKIL
jgi:hydrogenase expression/formation protein HypD